MLFADLSGYTAVAERMDPETVKSLVDRALQRLGQEVVRYGGRVDKYIGDNVMAVFGAPVAHEDDPERAVRAGLAMQAAMEEINEPSIVRRRRQLPAARRDQLRRGARRPGRQSEYTVMGDPVNVAARLQAAARPGSVTVGEITHRLTARRDRVRRSWSRSSSRASPSRCPAWEAVRVHRRRRRRRVARAETPLIGREDESSAAAVAVRAGRPTRAGRTS